MSPRRTAAGQPLRKFTTLCDAAFGSSMRAHGFSRAERDVSTHICWHVYRNQDRYVKVTATTHVLDGASHCRVLVGEGPHSWPDCDWNSVSLWILGRNSAPRRSRLHYPLNDVTELGGLLQRMSLDLQRKAKDFLRGDLRRLRASHAALAQSRQPYIIYTLQPDGTYVGRVDPHSDALRSRFAAESDQAGSSLHDASLDTPPGTSLQFPNW